MRIDLNGKIDGIYQNNLSRLNQPKEDSEDRGNTLKTDSVELSKSAQGKDELTLMKETIANELDRGTPPDKLRRLRSEIDNGTYRVSASDIAVGILKK